MLANKRRSHDLAQGEKAERRVQAEENARIWVEHAERARAARVLRQAREVARCKEEAKARIQAQVEESAKIRVEHTEGLHMLYVRLRNRLDAKPEKRFTCSVKLKYSVH